MEQFPGSSSKGTATAEHENGGDPADVEKRIENLSDLNGLERHGQLEQDDGKIGTRGHSDSGDRNTELRQKQNQGGSVLFNGGSQGSDPATTGVRGSGQVDQGQIYGSGIGAGNEEHQSGGQEQGDVSIQIPRLDENTARFWKDAVQHMALYFSKDKWTVDKSLNEITGLAVTDLATTTVLTGGSVAATMVTIGSIVDLLPRSELLELFTLDSMFHLEPGYPTALFYSAAAISAAASAVKTVYQSDEKRRSAIFMNNKILKLATVALALTGTGLALRHDVESMLTSVSPATKHMFDVHQSSIINSRISFFNDIAPDTNLERVVPEMFLQDLEVNTRWLQQHGTLSFKNKVESRSVLADIVKSAYNTTEAPLVYKQALDKFANMTIEEQAQLAVLPENMNAVSNLLLKVEDWLAVAQSEDGWEKNLDIAELLVRDLFLKERGYALKLYNIYNMDPAEWMRADSDNAFFLVASRLAYENPMNMVYGTQYDPRVATAVNSLYATMDIVGNNYLTRRNWMVNFFKSDYFKDVMLPLLQIQINKDTQANVEEMLGRNDTLTKTIAQVPANAISALRSVNDALHTRSGQNAIAMTIGAGTSLVMGAVGTLLNQIPIVGGLVPTASMAAASGVAAAAVTKSYLSPYADEAYDLVDRFKVLPRDELIKQLEVMIHANSLPLPLHETVARVDGLQHADDSRIKEALADLNKEPGLDTTDMKLANFDMHQHNKDMIEKIEARQHTLDVRDEYRREAPVVTSLLSDIQSDMVMTKYGIRATQDLTTYVQPDLPPVLMHENKERLIREIDDAIESIQKDTDLVAKHMKVYPVEAETPAELADFESSVRYAYSFLQSYRHDDAFLYNQLTKPTAAIEFLAELKDRIAAIETYTPMPDAAVQLLKKVYL